MYFKTAKSRDKRNTSRKVKGQPDRKVKGQPDRGSGGHRSPAWAPYLFLSLKIAGRHLSKKSICRIDQLLVSICFLLVDESLDI